MTSFRVDTPRGPVAGIETGRGAALVLVAGLGSSHRIWGDLPGVLARRFTVIAIDNRGIGGSRSGQPFSLADAALDVVAAVDGRGHHHFALLGASMGGAIALATALQAPHRVRCLVLASCAARLSGHGRRSLELLRDLLRHLPPERVGPALMTMAFAPPFSRRFPGLVDEAARL
jgi:pimeloyl-ACP methyl ester carboxylesterase